MVACGLCFAAFAFSAMSTDYRSISAGPWDVSGATTTDMYLSSCVETTSRCEPECAPLANEFPSGVAGYDVVISATTVSGLLRSCATGFSGYPVVSCDGDSFSALTGCCNASEPSVKACTSCNGTQMSDCTAATCAGSSRMRKDHAPDLQGARLDEFRPNGFCLLPRGSV